MTQKERDSHGFFQHAETNIYEIPYVYLASPFSHPDPKVRKARVAAIAKITARLIAEGHIVFSPVAYTAEIQKDGDPPAGWYRFHAPAVGGMHAPFSGQNGRLARERGYQKGNRFCDGRGDAD